MPTFEGHSEYTIRKETRGSSANNDYMQPPGIFRLILGVLTVDIPRHWCRSEAQETILHKSRRSSYACSFNTSRRERRNTLTTRWTFVRVKSRRDVQAEFAPQMAKACRRPESCCIYTVRKREKTTRKPLKSDRRSLTRDKEHMSRRRYSAPRAVVSTGSSSAQRLMHRRQRPAMDWESSKMSSAT